MERVGFPGGLILTPGSPVLVCSTAEPIRPENVVHCPRLRSVPRGRWDVHQAGPARGSLGCPPRAQPPHVYEPRSAQLEVPGGVSAALRVRRVHTRPAPARRPTDSPGPPKVSARQWGPPPRTVARTLATRRRGQPQGSPACLPRSGTAGRC